MSEQDTDVELDTQDQPGEEPVKTDEVNEPAADAGAEDLTDSIEKMEKLKEQNKKLFERAKDAETKLKELKKQPEQPTNADTLSREEAILIAQGMQAEDLDELKAVAEAKKLPLLKAKDTELFKGYLDLKETERKKEKAKLSASKGSQQAKEEKSPSEMTKEEHMAWAKEMSQNLK